MRLGQDVLSDLDAALAREWLLANGLGGTASGTAAGAHTRRAHALLISSDPNGRLAVSLLRLDERLHAGAEHHELACNLHAASASADGVAAVESGPGFQARPAGHRLLEEFRADPWPTWRWRAGGVTLEKSVFTVHGHNAVVVTYRHLDGPPARLTVSPLIAARDPGGLQREDEAMHAAAQVVPGRVRLGTAPGMPVLSLWHGGSFMPARVWQRGLVHPADRSSEAPRAAGRGKTRRAPPEVATEDAFVPGYLEGALPVGGVFHVVAATEEDLFRALAVEGRLGAPPPRSLAECVELLARGERDRVARWSRAMLTGADFTARQAATAHGGPGETLARRPAPLVDTDDPWVPRLTRALADGLVQRGERMTLLTALPAGAERGADTLRALPALIALRAFDSTREVLRGYVEYLNEGLAPERFDPDGRPRYGDPAPALWLVHAAELLARRSEDLDLVRDALYPAIESIMQAYRAGTRDGIHVRATGLLSSGVGDDACCRADVNALWFHALVATAQLARLTGSKEAGAFYLAWAREHQTRMLAGMWDARRGCFYEALAADGPRPGKLSPSQLLAVSLSPPLLPPEQAAVLVATVERELFMPFGLRASAGADTASPAWLGPFITAYLRVHQRSPESQARVRGWLEALRERLDQGGLVHVPEALPAPRRGDAAARRAATAAVTASPAPASVLAAAELLRVWIEEVDRAEAPAGVA
jgi:hypothetical protein